MSCSSLFIFLVFLDRIGTHSFTTRLVPLYLKIFELDQYLEYYSLNWQQLSGLSLCLAEQVLLHLWHLT